MKKVTTEELIGTVYKRLTIIGEESPYTEPSGKKRRVVLCRCECGTVCKKHLKELRKGSTTSCGCYAKSLKLQLNGVTQFGHWTALEDEIKHRRLKVQCVCGVIKHLYFRTLLRGESKSCGCIHRVERILRVILSEPIDTEQEKWKHCFDGKCMISSLGRFFDKDLNYVREITKTFVWYKDKKQTLITLLYNSFYGEFDEKEFVLIKIQDDLPITLDNIFLARKTSIGFAHWISKLKSNLTQNGKGIVNITKADIIDKYKEQNGLSYFLKIPMDLSMKSDLLSVSVDRIDNTKGYAPDNFTLVTRFENMGRRSNTFEDMKSFADNYIACNK